MNKERRNKIQKVINELLVCKTTLNELLDEEEDAYDNMPENLQSSIRAQNSEEAIDYMSEAIESLEQIVEQLQEVS